MKKMLAVLTVLMALTIGVHASDKVGVYALVDKVVFEPSVENPERIQIWGSFAVATRNDRNSYDPVQRGYLYLSAPRGSQPVRAEWNDLEKIAGTRQIVAFSSRFGQSLRVRTEKETPQTPDQYTLGVGLQIMRSDSDYAPVRSLAAQISR